MTARALRWGSWIAGSALVAAIAHILFVLLIPSVGSRGALQRLDGAPGALTLLDPSRGASGAPPYDDPAAALAICKYDLAMGPLSVSAPTDEAHFLSVALLDARATPFYSVTNRAAVRGKIELVVGDARQISALEANDSDETPNETLRLKSPTQKGFVLARALLEHAEDGPRARAALQSIRCEIINSEATSKKTP